MTIYNPRVDENRKVKLLTVLYRPEWGWGWRSGLVRIFCKDEAVLCVGERHAD